MPNSSMSAHANILGARKAASSPIFPTPVKRESQSPSSHYFETPAPNAQSVSYESVISSEQRAQSASTLRKPNDSPCLNLHSCVIVDLNSDGSAKVASLPSGSPRLELRLTPHHTGEKAAPTDLPGSTKVTVAGSQDNFSSSPSSSSSSGLKLRLRGIHAALQDPPHTNDNSTPQSRNSSTRKRTSFEASFDDDYDTDSEIDIMPPMRKVVKLKVRTPTARTTSRIAKKMKTVHEDSEYDDDDTMFDTGNGDSSPISSLDSKLILSSNVLKRSERMLDPSNPEHAKLIAAAPKAGPEYYDSDTDELPGDVKETNKPYLFRNVKWGFLATDYSNPADFTTEPELLVHPAIFFTPIMRALTLYSTQFVPGRFERLPDNTAFDQKHKLIIKLTDKQHRHRIFLNPPPRNWNNQEAITALNKRSVQQIRRNTSVRFREVVEPYVKEEREWILDHLTEGKPSGGWKKFVNAFNREFEGKKLPGSSAPRPERSHSSLTKEVERFGKMYAKGVVPKTVAQGKGVKKGKE